MGGEELGAGVQKHCSTCKLTLWSLAQTAKSSSREALRNKHPPLYWQPLTDSHLPLQMWLPWLRESLLQRELFRQLRWGLGKELSNAVFNLSNNKNNASFGAESPHRNLSKFRAGHTCQPLLHCCYVLLWPCNMYNIHTRGILSHFWVLPSNNTFFLKEFLVRKRGLSIQNSHFVKLKRKTSPHPLRAVSDP